MTIITLIGAISSGKSSLINSFSGNFLVPVSLLKQTNGPVYYNLKHAATIDNQYITQKILDKKKLILF